VRPRRAALLAAFAALACAREPRGPCEPAPTPGQLGSVCGFENPEDLAFVPTAGVLLVSQMRHPGGGGGSLAALVLGAAGEPVGAPRRLWPPPAGAGAADGATGVGDPACTQPPAADRFAPHGLALGGPAAGGELPVAVVGHGAREAVELFALRGAGEAAALRWTGCVPLPPHAIGNDVVLAADGGLLVTNYQPALGGLRGLYYTVAGGLGYPTGEVLRWRGGRWEPVPGTRGANPNGLLVLPGGARLAVAFSGARALALRPLGPEGGAARDLALDGHPDNLAWSARGTLLVPLHTSGFGFLRCRFGRGPCASPWTLLEVDPANGKAASRLVHDGRELGAVSSVAEVGERLYLGAVFDDRIGLWHEPRPVRAR
jgi:hypothetical protein